MCQLPRGAEENHPDRRKAFGKATAATTDKAANVSVMPNHGTGHWVFQNTKGDAIWTDMDLTSAPLDANGRTTFQGTLTVISGSGKFVGATGRLLGIGFAEGNADAFSITGTVNLSSSDDGECRGLHRTRESRPNIALNSWISRCGLESFTHSGSSSPGKLPLDIAVASPEHRSTSLLNGRYNGAPEVWGALSSLWT